MSAHTRSMIKVPGSALRAVSGVVGLLALNLLSLLIAVLWADHTAIGDVAWQAMVAVHSVWVAIAAALIALAASSRRRMRSAKETIVRIAACTSLAALATAVGAAFLQANHAYRPLNTESDVRPRLEILLKQRVRSSPRFARTGNLSEQIRNVRISGPAMTFEPETTRHVTFDLDTGCDRIIEVLAVLDAGDADNLSSVDRNNCQP